MKHKETSTARANRKRRELERELRVADCYAQSNGAWTNSKERQAIKNHLKYTGGISKPKYY